jgi:hypothetical protein
LHEELQMKIKTMVLTMGGALLALGLQVQQVQAQTTGTDVSATKAGMHRARGEQAGHRMGGRGDGARGRMMQPRPAGAPLEVLDSNDDGMLSLDEFLARGEDRPARGLGRVDANGDGLLSREELEARQRPQRPEIDNADLAACLPGADDGEPGLDLAERFDTLDTNDDSFLDADELAAGQRERATAQFERLDADADGFVTAAELEAAHEEQMAQRMEHRDCMRAAMQPSGS